MLHRLFSAFACLLTLTAGAVLAPSARAAAFDVKISGTVTGLGAASTTTNLRFLSVNTRLGPKTVEVGPATLILLNNHTSATTNITVGEQVDVIYDYRTLLAKEVHLFNETKISGKVVSVTATSVTLRKNGANITLTTNAGSVLDLNGIPLSAADVLVGQKAKFIFEPGSNLVLSSTSSANLLQSTLTSVDTVNGLITVAGKQPVSLTVDTNATILRNGQVVPLTSLVSGDRLRIAFTRDITDPNHPLLRLLALEASPLTNPGPAKK